MTRLAFFMLISWLCASISQAAPPTNWPFKSWDEAVAISKAEHKPLFVLFGYEECEWCHYLYHRGMNDAEVLSKYSSSFSLTFIDTKATPETTVFHFPDGSAVLLKELLRRYRVYPVPSWVFLSETGVLLHSNRGGRTPTRELLRDLEVALAKSGNLSSAIETK